VFDLILFLIRRYRQCDKACVISMPGASPVLRHTSNKLTSSEESELDEMKGVQTYSAAIMPSPAFLFRFKVAFSFLNEFM
jgi:hypothetical protein